MDYDALLNQFETLSGRAYKNNVLKKALTDFYLLLKGALQFRKLDIDIFQQILSTIKYSPENTLGYENIIDFHRTIVDAFFDVNQTSECHQRLEKSTKLNIFDYITKVYRMLIEMNEFFTYEKFYDCDLSPFKFFQFESTPFLKSFFKNQIVPEHDSIRLDNFENLIQKLLSDHLLLDFLSKINKWYSIYHVRPEIYQTGVIIKNTRVKKISDEIQEPLFNEALCFSNENFNSKRNDGLLIFGKNEFSDIRFKDFDLTAENISLILHFSGENLYATDFSQSMNAKIALRPETKYELEEGMVFCIGDVMHFYIKSIGKAQKKEVNETKTASPEIKDEIENLDLDDENKEEEKKFEIDQIYTIEFEFLDGGYKKLTKEFSTAGKDLSKDISFCIGKGGNGSIDLFLDNIYLSARHLKFIFDVKSKKWNIEDYKSKNGTFLLIKTKDKFSENNSPEMISIFEPKFLGNGGPSHFLTLVTGKYIFTLEKK